MKGTLKDSPGSSFMATTLPNCKTNALFLSSTIKTDERAKTRITTKAGIKYEILRITYSPCANRLTASMEQRLGHHHFRQLLLSQRQKKPAPLFLYITVF